MRKVGKGVSFLFFVGGFNGSEVERMVGRAHQAITLDVIDIVLSAELAEDIIVSTDSPEFAASLVRLPVAIEIDQAPFHFGQCLRRLIHKYDVQHAFYIGGGSAPLLSRAEIETICQLILEHDRVQVTNNLWSCDLVAFSPALAIDHIDLPAIDNSLAFLLERQASLSTVVTERTAGLMFDVDTPSDLLVLQGHPATSRHTRTYIESLDLDTSHVRQATHYFTEVDAEIIVAGRVGTQVLARLESETACRTRVFSEERGMRASGREESGEVRSLLAAYYQAVGPQRFFETLGSMGQAAFLDSRIMFGHLGWRLSVADRFNSDLRRPDLVEDALAREFTRAAMEAPIPIVLGGHSIVAGGLCALIDSTWQEYDAQLASTRSPSLSTRPSRLSTRLGLCLVDRPS